MSNAQENCSSVIFRAKNSLSKPVGTGLLTLDAQLNGVLSDNQAITLKQARPDGKTQKVRDLYEIKLSDNQKIDDLYNALKGLSTVDEVTKVCDYPVTEFYHPATGFDGGNCQGESFNDPSLQGSDAWYLDGMNIPCAWTVTHGSPSQVVAVVDIYFDYSHDDLQNKFVSITNVSNFSNPACGHGFASAGAVAAIVNNGICTVGSGYDTKVAGYIVGSTCGSGNPRPGILQAMADGHKTITVSFTGTGLLQSEIEEYINDGGTLIHSAYGNYNSDGNIDGYIYVAQADQNFNHDNGYGAQGGSDIYALCVGVNRLQGQNTCAYGSGNTSFGAPTVAGIVALMKSVNSCLSPQDIDKILKLTQGQLPNNAPVGNTAGIMDAYQAVLMAQEGLDLVINQNTLIDGVQTVSGNVIIKNGATLTVTGTLKSAKKIIVEKGGHLNVNGGLLTGACGQWTGVIVEGNGSNQNGAGKVTLTNNAIIEHAKTAVSMDPDHIPWPARGLSWGGLIKASNATFRDCRRAVEFMPMSPDNSRFDNCNFLNLVNDGVTLWDNVNVKFSGCNFNQIGKSSVLAYDSRVEVTFSTFQNANNGIEFISTNGNSHSSNVFNNIFSDNLHGIYAIAETNPTDLEIHYNNFYGGEDAITIEGMSSYTIYKNTMIGSGYGVKLWASGIPLNNSLVVDNNFTSGYWGSLANYANEAEYLNNCFRYNGKDLEVNSGSIYAEQGNLSLAASNCFSKAGTKDITTFNNTPFEYYYKINDPNCRIPTNPGNYIKMPAFSEIENNCGNFTGPAVMHRTCNVTLSKVTNEKMLKDIEDEIKRLEKDKTMDPLLKAYLIKRYQLCIAKIKRALVVTTKNEPESGKSVAQAAVEAAQYAKTLDDFIAGVLGFSMLTETELYDEAQDYLDTFGDMSEQGVDFVTIQNINLQYMRNRGIYVIDSLSKNVLKSIGMKTTPVSGFARGLYYKLTGEKLPIEFISGGNTQVEYRSITDAIDSDKVKIFPNPASDILTFALNLDGNSDFEYSVMDAVGVVKKSGTFSGNGTKSLDIKGLPSGMYFVSVLKEDSSLFVKKFIKQ